jgi:uncharacterized protein YndB with AHSA1/START domain
MNKKMNDLTIKQEIIIDASIEKVFRAITDADQLTQWFPDVTILEAKEGGDVQFTFLKDKSDKLDKHLHKLDKDHHVVGKIMKIVPNKELSYTWKHKDIPDFPETIVSWQLEQLDENKTKLILTHTGFTDKDKKEYNRHTEGWSWFIRRLQNYVTKGDSR